MMTTTTTTTMTTQLPRFDRVLHSPLKPSRLKLTALALAFAIDHEPVYRDGRVPVAHLAARTGKSTRQITRDLSTLVGRGVLVVVGQRSGGTSATAFAFNLDALTAAEATVVDDDKEDDMGDQPTVPPPAFRHRLEDIQAERARRLVGALRQRGVLLRATAAGEIFAVGAITDSDHQTIQAAKDAVWAHVAQETGARVH